MSDKFNEKRNIELSKKLLESKGYKVYENSKSTLETEIQNCVKEIMMSSGFGFSEDEVEAYSSVEVRQEDSHTVVEVRAEISYDGLIELAENLDDIVAKYDKDAYFDVVTSGIIEAHIYGNINESKRLKEERLKGEIVHSCDEKLTAQEFIEDLQRAIEDDPFEGEYPEFAELSKTVISLLKKHPDAIIYTDCGLWDTERGKIIEDTGNDFLIEVTVYPEDDPGEYKGYILGNRDGVENFIYIPSMNESRRVRGKRLTEVHNWQIKVFDGRETEFYGAETEEEINKKYEELMKDKGENEEISKPYRINRDSELLDKIMNSEDPLQTAFKELVPSAGEADTVAGELVRAMMRLLYRDYNDGDVFYEGYGLETCASSASFLMNHIGDTQEIFERLALSQAQDNEYSEGLKKVSDIVINYIKDNPNTLSDNNSEDSRDYPLYEIEEWVPEYDLTVELPYNVIAHLEADNINTSDLEYEMGEWDGLRNADISVVNGRYVEISGLDKEWYDELEIHLYSWLENYGEDLNDEFGDPEENYDGEDEEE